ncbi:MAG: methylmalonyl-CoA epimerase [Candidatus Marinimicrobia bacterium]|nr:methylmalonyl-CoA epimerase [Candidatus Neomarinimicrobiota bacterium]|tara:strand:- start:578 stop:997 length:420 start_codon:yes stop_codon:yes gene_type:complete
MRKGFRILKINHVAIAVNDNKSGLSIFELLGMNIGKTEFVKNERVNVVKVKADDPGHAIELLEASDNLSVIKKYINKNGQGLHHIALETDNIKAAINYLELNSIEVIYNPPKIGADNKLVTFISPKSTPGILIELCQSS